MVHALVGAGAPHGSRTFTLSSTGPAPAPDDFDWTGLVAAVPEDCTELSGPQNDSAHRHGRRLFLLSIATVLGAVGVRVLRLVLS